MSQPTLKPANVVAAILVLGGLLMVLMPRHTLSILQVMILSGVAAAGIHALVANVPVGSAAGWSMSPFSRSAYAERERHESHEVDRIRAKFRGRRYITREGPSAPPEVLHLLRPLVLTALRREGIDPEDAGRMAAIRPLLSSAIRAVIDGDLPRKPSWFQTRSANEKAVGWFVTAVLDDLDRLPNRLRES